MPSSASERAPQPQGAAPPHDLDAEQSVLGSILLDPSRLDDVVEALRPEDFYRENHGQIYSACVGLWREGEPIDTVTVAARLEVLGVLARVGGRAGLLIVQESTPTASNIEHYARIVKQLSLRRQLARVSADTHAQALDVAQDVDDALQQAQQQLFRLAEDDFQEGAVEIEAILADVLKAYDERMPGQIVGLTTGFPDLDRMLNGLKPGEVYIVAARPNMGKTSWLLQVARTVATKQSTAPLLFSLEMSRDQIVTRLLCQEAQVDAQRFERSELSQGDWDRVTKAVERLQHSRIKIDDTPTLDEIKVLHRARQFKRRHDVGLVMLDYVQLLNSHRQFREGNAVQEMTAVSKGMKMMARQLQVPVLIVSQLSRGVEQRKGTDFKPRLSDLRESGALEQDAAAVMFLFRPEYYEEGKRPGICEVIVAKNRFGPTGSIELVFRKELTRFESKSRETQ